MPSHPPTLKSIIITIFGSLDVGEALTSAELVEGALHAGHDFGEVAITTRQRILLTERVLTRLVTDGTLTTGTAGPLRVWRMPAAPPSPPAAAEPKVTALPVRPVTRPAEIPSAAKQWGLTQNGFAAAFTAVVLAAAGLLVWAVMPSDEFEARPATPQPVALPSLTPAPTTTVATSQPPPTAAEDTETREVLPGDRGVPAEFVPETAFTLPPGDGHGECTVFGGHTPDGQYWEDLYCADTSTP